MIGQCFAAEPSLQPKMQHFIYIYFLLQPFSSTASLASLHLPGNVRQCILEEIGRIVTLRDEDKQDREKKET